MSPPIEHPKAVADFWASYSGDTAWVKELRRFGELGGKIQYWGGVPRSASAIPLTFALFAPCGAQLECRYRLKDIRAAVQFLEGSHDRN